MLTIIACMERELSGLRRELRPDQTVGEYPQLELAIVGVGGARAGEKVTSLVAHRQLSKETLPEAKQGILLLGFSGGVDPSLTPGVLAISTHYQQAASGNSLLPDPEMWRQAVQAATDAGLPSDQRDSLTVDRPVSTVADKGAVFRRYQVGTVNMEDYHVAAVARDAGVPFLAVRAVLDPANQTLPPYVLAMSRSPVKAVLGTAVRPWRITPMLKLARQMRLAQFALTRFAVAYLRLSLDRDQHRSGESPAQATAWPAGR